MNVSIYQAAAALSAFDRAQEVIAENMASTSVNGFKKQIPSFSAVQAGLIPASVASGVNQHFLLPNSTSTINFEPGQAKYTGSKTDLAIDGQGFFEVHLPQGGVYYTRDGEFKLNSKGQLVTKGGGLVMGDGGPLQFDMTRADKIAFAPSGEVMQGNTTVGKLKVVDFNNPQLLKVVGNGNFVAEDPALLPVPATNATVRQGFVEGSNASIMQEMASLLTNIRQYETNQRVIQMNDERMGHAIATLGEAGN